MSTATTTTAENAGLPAMLDTKDVAEMFKRCNLAVYAEARRIYYREVNLNPCKKYPKQVLQRIEWWFWDWFAYDCAVSGIGLTGNESEDLRIELQYGPGAGISPFLALAEFMYDKDERIGTREIRDFREFDDTNFASMFWIRDASAVKGRLTVEDIIHGGVYEVADVHAASQYDGAHGGMIVNRIAHVRGVWRSCSIPIYEARRPDDPQIGDSLARSFRETGLCRSGAVFLREGQRHRSRLGRCGSRAPSRYFGRADQEGQQSVKDSPNAAVQVGGRDHE